MKLRITNNSIRVRVRKSELIELADKARIEEFVNFGNEVKFSFALMIDQETQTLKGDFQANSLNVYIPQELGTNWMKNTEVGIESTTKVSETEHLHILIEKDFPCLDRPNEDKSDTFWELVPDKNAAC